MTYIYTASEHVKTQESLSTSHVNTLIGALAYHGRPSEFHLLLADSALASATFMVTATSDVAQDGYSLAYYTYPSQSVPSTQPQLIVCGRTSTQYQSCPVYQTVPTNLSPVLCVTQWCSSLLPMQFSRASACSVSLIPHLPSFILHTNYVTKAPVTFEVSGFEVKGLGFDQSYDFFTCWATSGSRLNILASAGYDGKSWTSVLDHTFTHTILSVAQNIHESVIVCANGDVWWNPSDTEVVLLHTVTGLGSSSQVTYFREFDIFVLFAVGVGLYLYRPRTAQMGSLQSGMLAELSFVGPSEHVAPHIRVFTLSGTGFVDVPFNQSTLTINPQSELVPQTFATPNMQWSSVNRAYMEVEPTGEEPVFRETNHEEYLMTPVQYFQLAAPITFQSGVLRRGTSVLVTFTSTTECIKLFETGIFGVCAAVRTGVQTELVWISRKGVVRRFTINGIIDLAWARSSLLVATTTAVYAIPASLEHTNLQRTIFQVPGICKIASDGFRIGIVTSTHLYMSNSLDGFVAVAHLRTFPAIPSLFKYVHAAKAWALGFQNGCLWVSSTTRLWGEYYPGGPGSPIREFGAVSPSHWIAVGAGRGYAFHSKNAGLTWASIDVNSRYRNNVAQILPYSSTEVALLVHESKDLWGFSASGWRTIYQMPVAVHQSHAHAIVASRTLALEYQRPQEAPAQTSTTWTLTDNTYLGFCLVPQRDHGFQQSHTDRLAAHPGLSPHGIRGIYPPSRQHYRRNPLEYQSIVYRVDEYTFQVRFPSVTTALFTVQFHDPFQIQSTPRNLYVAHHSFFDNCLGNSNSFRWSDVGMYMLEDVPQKFSDKSYNDLVFQYEIDFVAHSSMIDTIEYRLYIRQRSCTKNHTVSIFWPFGAISSCEWRLHKLRSLDKVESGVKTIGANQRVNIIDNVKVFEGPLRRFVNCYGIQTDPESVYVLFFDFNDSSRISVSDATVDWYRVFNTTIDVWSEPTKILAVHEGSKVYKNIPQLIRIPWRTECYTPKSGSRIMDLYPQFVEFANNFEWQHRWYTTLDPARADLRLPYVPWPYEFGVREDTTTLSASQQTLRITTYESKLLSTPTPTNSILRINAVNTSTGSKTVLTPSVTGAVTTVTTPVTTTTTTYVWQVQQPSSGGYTPLGGGGPTLQLVPVVTTVTANVNISLTKATLPIRNSRIQRTA